MCQVLHRIVNLADTLLSNADVPFVAARAETALGSGEFGEVFKGTWETPYGPQEVAIKMLKEGSTDKEKTTFLQEAAIMAQFRHPHVVRLLGAVTMDEPVSGVFACMPKEGTLLLCYTDNTTNSLSSAYQYQMVAILLLVWIVSLQLALV